MASSLIEAREKFYNEQAHHLDFKLNNYLQQRAPHLAPFSFHIEFWSHYSDVKPCVILALMEMQSGIVRQPSRWKALQQKPFGQLSRKQGFEAQLQDVLEQLSGSLYGQRKEIDANGRAVLDFLVSQRHQKSPQDIEMQYNLQQFTAIYRDMYQREFQTLTPQKPFNPFAISIRHRDERLGFL